MLRFLAAGWPAGQGVSLAAWKRRAFERLHRSSLVCLSSISLSGQLNTKPHYAQDSRGHDGSRYPCSAQVHDRPQKVAQAGRVHEGSMQSLVQ